MGAEVGKCVCAPDSKDFDSESYHIKGEKDKLSTTSSSSIDSSSEGDGDQSSFESEDTSSSSHHHKKYRRRRSKKDKTRRKRSKSRRKHEKRKNGRKKRKYRSKQDEIESSSSSSTEPYRTASSSDDRSDSEESDSSGDNRTMIYNEDNHAPPYASHQIIRGHSREYLLTKKLQKEQDRVKRKLQVIQQKRHMMLEKQKQSHSYNAIPDHPAFMSMQPSSSHPNLHTHAAFYENISDMGSIDTHSIHSVQSVPDSFGKHPRIPSMCIDPATIMILQDQKKVQEILTGTPGPGFSVDVHMANNMYNDNRSQSRSPHSASLDQQRQIYGISLTPTTHEHYHNRMGVHKGSQSVDGQSVQSFPNIQIFGTTPEAVPTSVSERRWSNPNANMRNHNIVFGQPAAHVPAPLHPQSVPAQSPQRWMSRKAQTMRIVDDANDLPVMPPSMVNRSNSAPHGNKPRIFDISTAGSGFHSMFSDNVETHAHAHYIDTSVDDTTNISPKPSPNDNDNITPKPEDITVNNLSAMFVNRKLKIHGHDPHAMPPSPPIESVYKPLDHNMGNLGSLAKITESTSSATPVTSMSTRSSLQQPSSDMHKLSFDASNTIELGVIKMNEVRVSKAMDGLSSPDDDEDTVVKQWMEFHQFNIPDDKVPDAALLSGPSDLSSDHLERKKEVESWRDKVENAEDSDDMLAPQSSTDDAVDDKRSNGNADVSNQQLYHSTYSTDSHPSSDYNDEEDHMNVVVSHEKRHSHLMRKGSFKNWQPSDLAAMEKDMQKHYDHMQGMEVEAMQQRVNDLQNEHDESTTNWITQDQ